jgi:hypothetical protein
MIGILFFGTIAIWAFVALTLGIKLPKWLRIQRYRALCASVFVVLIFFAPVADEIIAYPQMQELCQSMKPYQLATGMDEKAAYGRTVDQAGEDVLFSLWPHTIHVRKVNVVYVDATTREPILSRSWFEPMRGMLGVPNGSSGGTMTLLLNKCGPLTETYDPNGFPSRFSHLKLTKISNH